MNPLWAAGALGASLLGCGPSTPPPAESPDMPTETPMEAPPPAAEPAPEQPPSPEPAAETPPPAPKPDDSIPDDYAMMSGDCVQLGKHFAAVTRSDQAAKLSPKITAQQRAQAEKNIDTVATKMGDQWTQTCEKSLVGKTVDPKALKCALEAKTVKEFDACLNSPPPPK